MRKFMLMFLLFLITIGFQTTSHAFFIDFEDGVDGARVNDIAGVSFLNYGGFEPMYADCRTGFYNCTSDDLGYSNNAGNYHHNGNFTIWAGPEADARGVQVDFTTDDGTWFTTGYSALSDFTVEAWLTDGSMVSTSGPGNTSNPMGYLTVNATPGLFIDYIVLHDTGNYWIVDDMSGDATGVDQVPEPGTILLFGSGLLSVVALRRKLSYIA